MKGTGKICAFLTSVSLGYMSGVSAGNSHNVA